MDSLLNPGSPTWILERRSNQISTTCFALESNLPTTRTRAGIRNHNVAGRGGKMLEFDVRVPIVLTATYTVTLAAKAWLVPRAPASFIPTVLILVGRHRKCVALP